jgi:hypothetical protein
MVVRNLADRSGAKKKPQALRREGGAAAFLIVFPGSSLRDAPE